MVHALLVATLLSQTPEVTPEQAEKLERRASRHGLSDAAIGKMTGEQIHDVLTRQEGEPPAIAIVAVISFFSTMALGIIAGLYAIYRIYRQRAETLRLMVEKGVAIPPELIAPKPRPANDLRRGLVLATFGLGLGVFLFAVASGGMWTLGLVPLFVGVGYLVAFRVTKDEPVAPVAAPPAAA